MRLLSHEQKPARSRWMDGGALDRSPDTPLELEPPPKARHDGGIGTRLKRHMVSMFPRSKASGARRHAAVLPAAWRKANPALPTDLQPIFRMGMEAGPAEVSGAANPQRKVPDREAWLFRLGAGCAQGALLALLLLARNRGIWPGDVAALSTAFLLAILIAPLALLEACDQVAPRLLLLWSGTLGFVIATLGLWQQMRGGLQALPVAAIGLFAFLVHVTVRAGLRSGRLWSGYGVWTGLAWTIGARILVWAVVMALPLSAFAFWNIAAGWMGAAHHGGFAVGIALLVLPLLGMASAAGFAVAAGERVRRARAILVFGFAFALPVLSAAALVLPALYLTHAGFVAAVILAAGAALAVAVHAFDWKRVPGRWRLASLGFVGILILEAAGIAGWDIWHRVAAEGWTEVRIYAAVAALVVTLYGLICLAETFSGLLDAAPMTVMDRAIPGGAMLVALLCLALSAPFSFPGASAPEPAQKMERHAAPVFVSPAPVVRLNLEPVSGTVAPGKNSKPGAPAQAATGTHAGAEPAGDIIQHTPGSFPPELLGQDWSGTDAAPCLTRASIACDIWFLDLDGDGRDEILFAHGEGSRVKANVMRKSRSGWIEVAAAASAPCPGLLARMRDRAANGGELLEGWRRALRKSMGQRPGAPPAGLPCPVR